MKNIVLIGMPGAGKSTIGVILAKALGMCFVDTDLLIQEREGELLQNIIDKKGDEEFLKIEANVISELNVKNAVIATGGSAVYDAAAMNHLKKDGTVIYLKLPLSEIKKRLYNIKTRGIAMKPGETIEDIFKKRVPLYEKVCDKYIDCAEKHVERIVEEIIDFF